MAVQVVGGVVVGLAFAPIEESVIPIGVSDRAHDGTQRSEIQGYKRRWVQATKPISQADATTLLAVLKGPRPVAVTGDITGAVSTHPEVTGIQYVPLGGGAFRMAVAYALNEV